MYTNAPSQKFESKKQTGIKKHHTKNQNKKALFDTVFSLREYSNRSNFYLFMFLSFHFRSLHPPFAAISWQLLV